MACRFIDFGQVYDGRRTGYTIAAVQCVSRSPYNVYHDRCTPTKNVL